MDIENKILAFIYAYKLKFIEMKGIIPNTIVFSKNFNIKESIILDMKVMTNKYMEDNKIVLGYFD